MFTVFFHVQDLTNQQKITSLYNFSKGNYKYFKVVYLCIVASILIAPTVFISLKGHSYKKVGEIMALKYGLDQN
jgi:cell division protein FtsL